MKSITIHPQLPLVLVNSRQYKQMRDKVIDDVMFNTRKVWKKDKEMIEGVQELCTYLKKSEFTKVSLELVRGMSGFIYWASLHKKKITAGSALSTLIHDLGEFRKNKHEDYFSPRTHSYFRFL